MDNYNKAQIIAMKIALTILFSTCLLAHNYWIPLSQLSFAIAIAITLIAVSLTTVISFYIYERYL